MNLLKRAIRHFVFGHSSTKIFLKGLKKKADIKAIKAQAKTIIQHHPELAIDAPSLGHLEFSAHVLAAYRIVNAQLQDDEKARLFIRDAVMAGFDTPFMRFALRAMLKACRHKPDRLYTIFGTLMRQYGISFNWSAPHHHQEGKCNFTYQIDRCFYFEFFKAHGVPKLTQVLCQLDGLWFHQINPKKHGFCFDDSRYQTQGYGAANCLFPIIEE